MVLDMTINFKPHHSLLPMSRVALSNVIPYDLCIVKSHTIQGGSFQCEHFIMAEMGTSVGCERSHGVPLYWWMSITMQDDNARGFESGAKNIEMTLPSAPLTRCVLAHKLIVSIIFLFIA